jgi:hypothetical protein
MKKIIYTLISLFLLSATLQAQKPEIFSTNGKAIKGFDVVAFFNQNSPVKGADSLSFQWKETVWLFSTKENLNLFKLNPEKYAPQYGGYCAYGVSAGHKSPTETDTWTIVNGKLFFNYNTKVKELWTKNQVELIKKADEKWEGVRTKD